MKCTIDSRELEVNEGESVLQAAKRFGIEIPHFCYHAKLSVAGSCRLCLVKVNNLPKLMPACNVIITPNMVIETQAEEVQRARRQVMQFIMLNHPVDCGICDKAGECTLQNYQQEYGAPQAISIDPKIHRRKLHELSPRISLDNERCILCSRCVRFTKEISGSGALGIVDRGSHSYVDRIGALPFDDPYSDNVIGICPTGALLSSDFLYKSRVWFLEPVRSVCTGCARGCSVQVWRRQKHREPRAPGMGQPNVAYRVTAFDNPQINGPWLCNKGFDLHKTMAQPRVLAAARPAPRCRSSRRLRRRARCWLLRAIRRRCCRRTHPTRNSMRSRPPSARACASMRSRIVGPLRARWSTTSSSFEPTRTPTASACRQSSAPRRSMPRPAMISCWCGVRWTIPRFLAPPGACTWSLSRNRRWPQPMS
jgi:ferredoxin